MQRAIVAFLCLGAVHAATLQFEADALENPIRRIVSLLQKMQKEVSDEGERDKDLNEKFLCYCEKNDGELSDSTAELRAKIPELESSIEESESLKAQLDAELKQHKLDRENAKASIESATKQREKEAADFHAAQSELVDTISMLERAVGILHAR